jgi:WS/DGAT/MGAT family acyltransferase
LNATRLTPLDSSFLKVESATAHMHVGWVALFSPPQDSPAPTFEDLREHVAGRLGRAPRYRQRLAQVPLGLHDPVWVDDEEFDITRHVLHAKSSSITEIIDQVMSTQLDRDDPLWELWIADRLADGHIGIVGKAHHCMVDGIAAVELAALLLDATPEPPPPEPDEWQPAPAPSRMTILAEGLRDRAIEELGLFRIPARIALSPKKILGIAEETQRATRTLVRSFSSLAPPSMLNRPISPLRRLASVQRPIADLEHVKQRFHTTINDVVLAASSGGMRRFLARRGEPPIRLKTMVPVNVHDGDGDRGLGNRISFMFVELPCDEPDPVRRLLELHVAMRQRKRAGDPQGGDSVRKMLGFAPQPIQGLVSRLVAGPRAFNLVVSNIPGPREPLYMRGCELEEAYPVVPLTDSHAVSIGITTIKDGAFFGIYGDRRSLPDIELLANDIDDSIEELIALS